MKDSTDFYNNFGKKLIDDYVFNNRRITAAIVNLSSFIPDKSENILDIGCGLGWSSHEFAKHFKNSTVKGIDLSPVLVETARSLFSRDNLSFEVIDIRHNLPNQSYDSVVMIDVYEHIPFAERRKFHRALKSVIKDQGRLLLACPSKYHQEWLRKNNPGGLQPIDEDIDCHSFNLLAQDLQGEVIFLEYQKIWRNMDYIYCVIVKKPVYNSEGALKSNAVLKLESPFSRIDRVEKKLNIYFPQHGKGEANVLQTVKRKINKRLKRLFNK